MGLYFSGVICFFIGCGLLIHGVRKFIKTLVFVRAAVKTKGTVIRIAERPGNDGYLFYYSVYEYKTNDGTTCQHTSSVGSSTAPDNIGATAELRFLKKNPRVARINSFSELWLESILSASMGFGFVGGAFLAFFYGK